LKPEELDSVLQESSFSAMKNNQMSTLFTLRNSEGDNVLLIPLLRKGEKGWYGGQGCVIEMGGVSTFT
jgi:hypothetical protein